MTCALSVLDGLFPFTPRPPACRFPGGNGPLILGDLADTHSKGSTMASELRKTRHSLRNFTLTGSSRGKPILPRRHILVSYTESRVAQPSHSNPYRASPAHCQDSISPEPRSSCARLHHHRYHDHRLPHPVHPTFPTFLGACPSCEFIRGLPGRGARALLY